jgi:hypothetical protein
MNSCFINCSGGAAKTLVKTANVKASCKLATAKCIPTLPKWSGSVHKQLVNADGKGVSKKTQNVRLLWHFFSGLCESLIGLANSANAQPKAR